MNTFITYLGFKAKTYGSFGWGRDNEYYKVDEDEHRVKNIIENENLPHIEGKMNSETEYMARRMWKREYNAYIALAKYCTSKKIGMPKDLYFRLALYNGVFNVPGNVQSTIELYKKYVIPLLEKEGIVIPNEFFEGISDDVEENTFGNKVLRVHENCLIIPEFETQLRDRALDLILQRMQEIAPTLRKMSEPTLDK